MSLILFETSYEGYQYFKLLSIVLSLKIDAMRDKLNEKRKWNFVLRRIKFYERFSYLV